MRLRADQLEANLDRNGLSPLYLISGEEPLQVLECADTIRRYAQQQNFQERIVYDVVSGFDWNTVLESGANYSLFSNKRLLEVRLGSNKPGKEGGNVLIQYAEDLPADNILIITGDIKLDKKTLSAKWCSILEKHGTVIPVWPMEPDKLPEWIKFRISKKGKKITGDAALLLAERVEGNLLAAKQEIDKLCLLIETGEINEDHISSTVTDSTRFDVFTMTGAAISGDISRAVRMLHGLRSEGVEPLAIHGALLWEFRQLCTVAYHDKSGMNLENQFRKLRVWKPDRKRTIKMAIKKHGTKGLHHLLRRVIQIERKIKSSDRSLAWDDLQSLLLEASGIVFNLPDVKYH